MKKHELIGSWIRNGIIENKFVPGEKLPSESRLRAQFGVSRNVVRQAIRDLAEAGWVQSARGIGTFCRSRVPSMQLTTNIAFVAFFASSYVFPEIIQGCDHVLYTQGFNLLLNQSEYDLEKERSILVALRKKRVDGIIIAPIYDGKDSSNAGLLEEMQAEGIPIVLCDSTFLDRRFSFVAMDDTAGGTTAAAHLWDRGHRKIGVFFQDDYMVKIRRMEGVYSYLERKSSIVRSEWIVKFRGQGPASGASMAAESFFRTACDLPTAFVCSSDEDALHLIQAAEKYNVRVPQDLSVIGFDNSSVAQLQRVSLTSVGHPGFSIGEMATNILLSKIFHPELRLVTRTLITPSIIERSSVQSL
jgi:GntR family transcriptional regulator, arabinose operon transcriptional repressor